MREGIDEINDEDGQGPGAHQWPEVSRTAGGGRAASAAPSQMQAGTPSGYLLSKIQIVTKARFVQPRSHKGADLASTKYWKGN